MDCRGHGARSRARGGSAEPGADPAPSVASAASAGCRAGPQRRRPPRGHTGLAGRVHTARPSAGRAPRTSLWVTKWRGAALSGRGVVESPRDAGRCGLCPPPPQTLVLQPTPVPPAPPDTGAAADASRALPQLAPRAQRVRLRLPLCGLEIRNNLFEQDVSGARFSLGPGPRATLGGGTVTRP